MPMCCWSESWRRDAHVRQPCGRLSCLARAKSQTSRVWCLSGPWFDWSAVANSEPMNPSSTAWNWPRTSEAIWPRGMCTSSNVPSRGYMTE